MNYEEYQIHEIPYWCRSCNEPVSDLLDLPKPITIHTNTVSKVCECCFNAICNDELETARSRQEQGETIQGWVERCNEVSQKYGFDIDYEFCENCWKPYPHEPDCIECRKDNYPERHKTPQNIGLSRL